MPNPEHVKILEQGVDVWNKWRKVIWSQDLDPDLSEADLTEANLQGVDFRRTNLSKALLIGAHLEGADFRGANLTEANLHRAHLSKTDLIMGNFSGANLSEADLSEATLGVNLKRANLRGANLRNAILGGANLVQADLTNANLSGASLRMANLSDTNLSGAILQGAKLQDTLLFNTDLTGARLDGADLRDARYTDTDLEHRFGDNEIVCGVGAEDSKQHLEEVPTHELIHFTTYYPTELRAHRWETLLVYAHLPQAIFMVKSDSEKRLGLPDKDYRSSQKTASTNIERGAEIVIEPEMAGCRFNPPRAHLLWLEDWHCAEFKVQALPELPGFEPGIATNGRLKFSVGPILIAEMKFWAYFSADIESFTDAPYIQVTNSSYDAIFVSYSHEDTTIVEQLESAYRVLGMQYLRDVKTLRSGEEWNVALLQKINEADIFQLCWSNAAKRSLYVEQEWRHAFNLKRPHFIRPTYWEQPMPEPPPELASIHFAHLDLKESKGST